MSSSLLPDLVTATLDVFGTALAAEDVEVRDGPVKQNVERAMLLVGATEDQGESAGIFGDWSQKWRGLGHVTRAEAFGIPCVLFVRSGDSDEADLAAARQEVFDLFALLEAAVRSDPTLGVSTNSIRTQILPTEYAQPQTPEGVLCRIKFFVNVEGAI